MNSIFKKFYSKKTIDRIDSKVNLLGPKSNINTIIFLNLRVLIILFMFVIVLITSKIGYILAPILSIVFYFLFEYLVFDYNIKKRAKKLNKEAIFFFEVFTLTLEGGRNLTNALKITTSNIEGELSLEFKQVLMEVDMGKSLKESLESLKKRIPSTSINNLILNLIQANTFGNNIIEAMNNEINYLRNEEIYEIKAEIAKLPMKISIISVIFLIPIMMLIILAPVLIQYLIK